MANGHVGLPLLLGMAGEQDWKEQKGRVGSETGLHLPLGAGKVAGGSHFFRVNASEALKVGHLEQPGSGSVLRFSDFADLLAAQRTSETKQNT